MIQSYENEIRQDIHNWINNFLNHPNPNTSGELLCPFAKSILDSGKLRIEVNSTLFSPAFYDKMIPTFDPSKEEVLILASTTDDRSKAELSSYCKYGNYIHYYKDDIYLMDFHPDDSDEAEEQFGTSDYSDVDPVPYTMLFVQKLSSLVKASRQLQLRNYYDKWEHLDYINLVKPREILWKMFKNHHANTLTS